MQTRGPARAQSCMHGRTRASVDAIMRKLYKRSRIGGGCLRQSSPRALPGAADPDG